MSDASTQEPLDIRDTLSAAFDAADGDGGGAGGQQPPAAPAPKPADTQAKPQDGAQPRDETGRFAPKDKAQDGSQAAPATLPADQAGAQQPEPQPQPGEADIRPPNAWSAPAKAKWQSLDPDIRTEIAKREADMQRGVAEMQTRLEDANQWNAVISPHREAWALKGMEPRQAVQALIAAQSFLDRDPVNGLLHIARSYGVNLQQLASGLGPQAAQPPLDPRLAQLYSQVSTLQQTLAQQSQAAEGEKRQALNSEIGAFAADPKNLYFTNVKDRMAALLGSGQASDLADAYDKACWADPDIRKLLLAEQSKTDQGAQQQAARAKANDAKKAGGSLTGAPGPATAPANGASPSIRQSLEEAWN